MAIAAHCYIYTLSLHVALPILMADTDTLVSLFQGRACHCGRPRLPRLPALAYLFSPWPTSACRYCPRSEEQTSELQSRGQLVCRRLLEKKNRKEEIAYDASPVD